MKQLMAGLYAIIVLGSTVWAAFELWNDGFSTLWNGDVPTPDITGPLLVAIFVGWIALLIILGITEDPRVNYDTRTGVFIALAGTVLAYFPYSMLLRENVLHDPVWTFSLAVPFTDVMLTSSGLLIIGLAVFHVFFVELMVVAPQVRTVNSRS